MESEIIQTRFATKGESWGFPKKAWKIHPIKQLAEG